MNVLILDKGQGGMFNSSKRHKILNYISAPAITWEMDHNINSEGIKKIRSIYLSLIQNLTWFIFNKQEKRKEKVRHKLWN